MKFNVSAQTHGQVRQLAKEVSQMLIPCYTFDGVQLKRAPDIQLRDTIIQKMIDPSKLVRVQLKYPEDGPDDRWYAVCEALLGGGLVHDEMLFRILGGSSSVKKGCFWLAADEVREQIHPYFRSSQEALSYLGVLFSSCHHGIHRLAGVNCQVVEDGEFDTADGQGFISNCLVESLGLPHRQMQVRLVGDSPGMPWLAIPADLPDGLELLVPKSMIKGAGQLRDRGQLSCWFGVRDVARTRVYSSSFTFAEWFGQDVLEAVWPTVEQRLAVLRDALTDRDAALRFLGLFDQEEELAVVRSKVDAFLHAGVSPDHPWLRRQLIQMMRREYVRLATGGGFALEGRMGAFAPLPDDVICAVDLPAGPVILSRYPIRDPHSIQAVWNEPDIVEHPLPGTVYLNNATALILDGDFDGDYFVTCSQEAAVSAVTSPSWYPDYRREDVPPKERLNDSLSALPFAAVKAVGNRIGSITYAIAGAVHAGKLEKVAALSAGLQAEVQSLKWNTRSDRTLLDDPDLQIPKYIAESKNDHDLFIRRVTVAEGNTPLAKNYCRVAACWEMDAPSSTPLVEFKHLIPIWLEPAALDFVEEAHAVVQMYGRWVSEILSKVGEPTAEDLSGPLMFLQSWDRSKTDNRRAWATALWHVVHGSRAATTGSAAFHGFSQEMVDLMLGQRGERRTITIPARKSDSKAIEPGEAVIPLVGALRQAQGTEAPLLSELRATLEAVTVQTRANGGLDPAFWYAGCFLGQIPRDHFLFGSITVGLSFTAMLQVRGQTVYLRPTNSNWFIPTATGSSPPFSPPRHSHQPCLTILANLPGHPPTIRRDVYGRCAKSKTELLRSRAGG